ncbi:hypothetical protein [Halostagnicola sp. A-GB9-2]|uniref:hypothetical protein n=1 Tax=Halostagnicola sp. A-GB9-2 TaxID=3048066 RepID=UPI0024C0C3D6|nr:hypothetical protein [Halostagnicola sp. A-GB9-2]MDJ1433416.1 hypothetical protein [Halostagnicola sp. A-GB9-2]
MERRHLLVSAIVGSAFSLSGCVGQQLPETPDKGTLWIQNQTNTKQVIGVEITDERSAVVLSEEYELSPEESDNSHTRETRVVSLNETYPVEATTADHDANYKWEVTEGTGILYVVIEDEELSFVPEPFEG